MGADGGGGGGGADGADSHWVRWHAPYEDPSSMLSLRLRTVQSMVRAALDEIPAPGTHPEPIRIVSLCAGQGRDVIDVVASHPRGPEVSALLVELDPALVAFARDRAAELGVSDRIRIVEGDASQARWYAEYVPADIVLICGVYGNISAADIRRTIEAMPGFCAPGGHVVWTRHRRPPDLTPTIRDDFAAAGFTERAFEAPDGAILAVGHHRLDGETAPFDADQQLFDFVGDGWNPA
jgi:ubiquinone/menaquinone biosynthesis C-methylase UbiE